MEIIKWAEKDVIRKERIKNLSDSIFAWIDGNILHSGLLEEMSDHEFKLYGFYNLAGDRLYCMSCCSLQYTSKILRMPKRDIIKAREQLIKKDLIAYQNRIFINSKGLKYKKGFIQVLSLPIDKIIITRRRTPESEYSKALAKYNLTAGYGRFLSERDQDQLLVQVTRDKTLNFDVGEKIKREVRKGKVRVKLKGK